MAKIKNYSEFAIVSNSTVIEWGSDYEEMEAKAKLFKRQRGLSSTVSILQMVAVVETEEAPIVVIKE